MTKSLIHRHILWLIIGLISILGLTLVMPPPADAQVKNTEALQAAAERACSTRANETQQASCRAGYRAGYKVENQNQVCGRRPSAERSSCNTGYLLGKNQVVGDLAAAEAAGGGGGAAGGGSGGGGGGSGGGAAGGAGAAVPDSCRGSFFGFPTWYKYLDKEPGTDCNPQLSGLSDIWLIVLAVGEILLRLAILVAIAFVIIGGVKYTTSQGNPEKTGKAKNTVVDALIGMLLAIIATTVISFIAGRFQG